jgi:oligoribonuclease NrnB/cAMP/cGMP phosphodiesterase (DHH superfamily)
MNNMMFDIVVFHYPCYDGLVASWVVYHYHKKHGMEIELYPIQHGEEFDYEKVRNKKVLFCDFSPKRDVLENIETKVKKIQILDHHKTAEEALRGKDYAKFDMNQSGAGLTWRYFYPDEKIPDFVRYIEDRDIWTWKYEETKPFTLGFYDLCEDYYEDDNFIELYNKCYNAMENTKPFIDHGYKLMNRINERIKETIDTEVIKGTYNNMNCRIIMCSREIVSDVGSKVSETFDFAVLWNNDMTDSGEYKISLRSNAKNNRCADVAMIAQHFGGGGHMHAASFLSPVHPNIIFHQD